ncbi:DASH complex subunit Dad2 [Pseudozyma hubeiensis SY62]|uniref:DASH complex subunit DAD2 n=1 Tax=Pseudozyma hubeiensis (strain SY62) TaxID=1305764 RepID=R9PMQ0_PSEHS|nr:DASH complex subunit Dad2 [Pseudozyma hubeiensis SY62]GAC99365.1 DASH complex subunit Dad2 [Pseudozyma hubeiensis SY62]
MYPQANNPANIMFGGPSSSANQMRLISKQAELEGLRALKDQSARMVKELERLAEKVDIMADGGDCEYLDIAIASVMGSWQGVFRAIQIARASTVFMNPPSTEPTSADTSAEQDSDDDLYNYGPAPTSKPALIDTMVRIPIDLDDAIARSKDETNAAADSSEACASVSQ